MGTKQDHSKICTMNGGHNEHCWSCTKFVFSIGCMVGKKENKPKIIVISGSGGVGKSTFVALCKELNNKVVEVSTVDEVKRIAFECGWDGTKTERNRIFLSDLKDLLESWNDLPNKKICEYIETHPDEIIFINAREPHNIQYYKDKYNATTVLVTNPRIKHITSNHADMEVYDYTYDYVIENQGALEDFKETARTFMKEI